MGRRSKSKLNTVLTWRRRYGQYELNEMRYQLTYWMLDESRDIEVKMYLVTNCQTIDPEALTERQLVKAFRDLGGTDEMLNPFWKVERSILQISKQYPKVLKLINNK